MNNTQVPYLTVPLGGDAHSFARKFAAEQATTQKSKQVYLNTMAVYAVHSYLKWLGIESNLQESDSWHILLRSRWDVADLVIPGIGKLECRPVLPGQVNLTLPTEVREERIGYLAVQFNESLDSVQLLGFAPSISAGAANYQYLRVANLQSLDVLLERLNPVKLSHWFENIFDAGWQKLQSLSGEVSAEKLFDLDISGSTVVAVGWRGGGTLSLRIVITMNQRADETTDITLEVYPAGGQRFLPPGLKVSVEDELGNCLGEKLATNETLLIDIEQSSDEPGDLFRLIITLGDVRKTKTFIV
ncbi:hypothetical protein BCD67_09690 [Oscillatoriales cyanobacterium USR001]|nr:hypothetical protein BCD67_09690 [Oscillatoriales cyanobacterium USR001]